MPNVAAVAEEGATSTCFTVSASAYTEWVDIEHNIHEIDRGRMGDHVRRRERNILEVCVVCGL